MEDIFIQELKINNVHNIKDITIHLDAKERKHLILTGKNGSGKTSVLKALEYNLKYIVNGSLIEDKQKLRDLIKKNKDPKTLIMNSPSYLSEKKQLEEQITKKTYIEANPLATKHVQIEYKAHKLLIVYFESKRGLKFNEPKGITKLNKISAGFKADNNTNFLQYIVNLKAEGSFARDDKDEETVKKIDAWFVRFEQFLGQVFDDDSLQLIFKRKKFSFDIQLSDGQLVNFNTLSDGYSSVLDIVTELIMRMEEKGGKSYNMQGIVLIDEIETHLHIDLQKKVLPFLTAFFPKIQFIVTTHSPFVLSSVDNAVVFDLETQKRVTDLSAYAVDGIVEGYFNNDKYSDRIKQRIDRYELLTKQEKLSEDEEDELYNLRDMLNKIPSELAPELVTHFLSIETLRLSK